MKLITKGLQKRFKTIGSQENDKDPIVVAKFFHPMSSWQRFATEYDPDSKIFFGVVVWDETERWNFSLEEIEELRLKWLPMERDLYIGERRMSEITELRDFIANFWKWDTL